MFFWVKCCCGSNTTAGITKKNMFMFISCSWKTCAVLISLNIKTVNLFICRRLNFSSVQIWYTSWFVFVWAGAQLFLNRKGLTSYAWVSHALPWNLLHFSTLICAVIFVMSVSKNTTQFAILRRADSFSQTSWGKNTSKIKTPGKLKKTKMTVSLLTNTFFPTQMETSCHRFRGNTHGTNMHVP